MTIDYFPFSGDGRFVKEPMLRLPGTNPDSVTNANARHVIDALLTRGHTNHSGLGSTLWVVLVWCQLHDKAYTLRAEPGLGYYVELLTKELT